jgi:hypothetical protein
MIARWRYATCDPFDYGRKCGLANISYLPDVTWRTSQDYIEFTRGWLEGKAQRKREERLRQAQEAIAAKAWRAELEQSRKFEAARNLEKGEMGSILRNKNQPPRRLKARGAG